MLNVRGCAEEGLSWGVLTWARVKSCCLEKWLKGMLNVRGCVEEGLSWGVLTWQQPYEEMMSVQVSRSLTKSRRLGRGRYSIRCARGRDVTPCLSVRYDYHTLMYH